MGMMIDDDLLYLHTSGNFGHTSSPGIWSVISNALLFMYLVVVTILGVLKKYVDDYNHLIASAARNTPPVTRRCSTNAHEPF